MHPSRHRVLSFLLMLFVGLMIGGCTTTPTQQSELALLIDASVSVAVQKNASTPAQYTVRAQKIADIAKQLQALDKGVLVSLPALVSALTPLLAAAGLGAADAAIANDLVLALETLIAQLTANGQGGNVQTTIQLVLTDIIAACGAYGAS